MGVSSSQCDALRACHKAAALGGTPAQQAMSLCSDLAMCSSTTDTSALCTYCKSQVCVNCGLVQVSRISCKIFDYMMSEPNMHVCLCASCVYPTSVSDTRSHNVQAGNYTESAAKLNGFTCSISSFQTKDQGA